jgi:NAD(P)-dependent dehydrogenase (short-subunit alcohol dehydrogenase family)
MSPQSIHQFAEKVALISDAASPVGRAVALQLALQGSYVIGLFQQEGGSLRELVELGTLAHSVNADPSTDPGAAEAAAAVDGHFGRLDLLVNCLKFRPESTFESVTEADFTDTVRRNLGSVQFLTKAVFGLMKDRPRPKIVNIVSAAADGGDPIFNASQAGIISLTASMAAGFPSNFRVNCVEVKEAPKPEIMDEQLLYRRSAGVAPDDVARAVLFLMSSESTAMNGRVVRLG